MSVPLSVLICLSAVQLCMGAQPVEEVITTKNVGLLGGWFERNPDSAEVEKATEQAVKMFNEQSRRKLVFKLVSVTAAQAQVTNVINYKIHATLRKTKCRKSENPDLEKCTLDKKQLKCLFEVTFDPRTNKHALQHHQCTKVISDKVLID